MNHRVKCTKFEVCVMSVHFLHRFHIMYFSADVAANQNQHMHYILYTCCQITLETLRILAAQLCRIKQYDGQHGITAIN